VIELVKVHDHALEVTEAIVTNYGWSSSPGRRPAEFDVRTQLRHMIAGNERFAAVAIGDSIESHPVLSSFDGDDLRGAGRPFGPAVAVPLGTSDSDRLVSWLGRQP
jgi:hypothetical protein